jgi:hypothetical protein
MALPNLQTVLGAPIQTRSAPVAAPDYAAPNRFTSMLSTVSAFAILAFAVLASVVWHHRCFKTCRGDCRCSDYF